MQLSKKVVLITGGASGMGLLCANRYAEEGAHVALTDINEEGLRNAVENICLKGGSAIGIRADVRNYDEVSRVCEGVFAEYGRIDILINCAGGASGRVFGCSKKFHEYPVEYIDWGIDVNLKGPVYFSRAAFPYMVKQRGGVIILLGSISGLEGGGHGESGGSVDYSTAKSALMNGFVKSLAQCGAKYGIRACTVSPGPVLTRPAMANMHTMLKRAAQPQEIVDLILYLTSDKASFITGTNYMIDGGGSRGY